MADRRDGAALREMDGRISYDEQAFEAWLAVYKANSGAGRKRPGPWKR